MKDVVRVMKALSDPSRLRILKMLEVRELCVCEIADVLGLSISTASRHLTLLRDAGFIEDCKDGKWVNYAIRPDAPPLSKRMLAVLSEELEPVREVLRDRARLPDVDRNTICGTR